MVEVSTHSTLELPFGGTNGDSTSSMPPNGMKAMEWVGTSTPMTLGVFRSVRTLAMIFKAVLVWFLVFKQAGGSEIHPQCHLYN